MGSSLILVYWMGVIAQVAVLTSAADLSLVDLHAEMNIFACAMT